MLLRPTSTDDIHHDWWTKGVKFGYDKPYPGYKEDARARLGGCCGELFSVHKSCAQSILDSKLKALQRSLLDASRRYEEGSGDDDLKAGHFWAQTQLSDAFIVGLRLAHVWPLGSVLVLWAISLWDADGFVAWVCAVGGAGLIGLAVDISNGGVEVTGGGGRDQTFNLRYAAVVVLFVLLVNSVVTVCFVDCGVHRWLKGTERERERQKWHKPLTTIVLFFFFFFSWVITHLISPKKLHVKNGTTVEIIRLLKHWRIHTQGPLLRPPPPPPQAHCVMLSDYFSTVFYFFFLGCSEHLHSHSRGAAVSGPETSVLGIREFNTHLPHCLTERGCRTSVQETEGSVTGGEKNKKKQKEHLDMGVGV